VRVYYGHNNKGLVKSWEDGVLIEAVAVEQLQNDSSLPFIYKWVASMPDAHLGEGACIGSVIPTIGAIIPAAVGVDIGCGMLAVQTNITASDLLPKALMDLRLKIERAIPRGRTDDGGPNDIGAWQNIPANIQGIWWGALLPGFTEIMPRVFDTKTLQMHDRARRQLGTLGTGNHFVEL